MPRNSGGTYSLPAGNPVVTGTTISSTWANTTLADLALAMTDSLSRTGQGGMTAVLLLADGAVGAPGLSWTSETTSGLYRSAAGDFRYSTAGVDRVQITSAGIRVIDGALGTPAFSFISDPDTGVFHGAANDMRLVAGGVLVSSVLSAGMTMALPLTTARVLGANGTVGAPEYTFASDPDTGMTRVTTNTVGLSGGGVFHLYVDMDAAYVTDGSAATPSMAFFSDPNTGFYRFAADSFGIAAAGLALAQFQNDASHAGIYLINGQVAFPSYSFTNDVDTGMYLGLVGRLDMVASGTSVLQFSDTTMEIGSGAAYNIGMHCITAATATLGASGALPAQVAGYMAWVINGTSRKIPYYNT